MQDQLRFIMPKYNPTISNLMISSGLNRIIITEQGTKFITDYNSTRDNNSVLRYIRRIRDLNLQDNLISISRGKAHIAFITESGAVYTIGSNSELALGVRTNNNNFLPYIVTLPDLNLSEDKPIFVECYLSSTVVLTEKGKVYVWGKNTTAICGYDSDHTMPRLLRQLPNNEVVIAISCGPKSIVFTAKSGNMYVLNDIKSKHYIISNKVIDNFISSNPEEQNGFDDYRYRKIRLPNIPAIKAIKFNLLGDELALLVTYDNDIYFYDNHLYHTGNYRRDFYLDSDSDDEYYGDYGEEVNEEEFDRSSTTFTNLSNTQQEHEYNSESDLDYDFYRRINGEDIAEDTEENSKYETVVIKRDHPIRIYSSKNGNIITSINFFENTINVLESGDGLYFSHLTYVHKEQGITTPYSYIFNMINLYY